MKTIYFSTAHHEEIEEKLQYIKEVFHQGYQTFLKDMKGFDWEGFLLVIND